MSNELIISATQDGCRIALLKDKTLVEFHQEAEGSKFTVGDIYLGTVKKVVPGLNAAFIDVGYDKDAFLHYLDLGPQFSSLQKFTKLVRSKKMNGGRLDKFNSEPDIDKHGKIIQRLAKKISPRMRRAKVSRARRSSSDMKSSDRSRKSRRTP